jgi:hypothetical protein
MDIKGLLSRLGSAGSDDNKNKEATTPAAQYNPALNSFNNRLFETVLDSFSAAALQAMAARRGLSKEVGNKKSRMITELYHSLLNDKNNARILENLSPEARYGLARIKASGGVVDRVSWRAQVESRFQLASADKIEKELIEYALVYYCTLEGMLLQFKGYGKHDINKPTTYYGGAKLCSPPKILDQFLPGKSLAEILAPPTPKAYTQSTPNIATPANYESLLADIFTFLRYIEQNSVKVLQTGGIGKRDFVKLNEQMNVKETANMADIRKMSELGRLNFLWNILYYSGLIAETADGKVVAKPDLIQKFYELPRYTQVAALTEAWVNSEFNEFVRIPTLEFESISPNSSDVPTMQQLGKARNLVMSLLQLFFDRKQLGEGWVDFGSFVTAVKNTDLEMLIPRGNKNNQYYGYGSYYGSEYYNGFYSKIKETGKKRANYWDRALKLSNDWELVEGEWLAELFREPLAWLGVAELGVTGENQRPVAIRLTELGRAMLAGKPTTQEEETARLNAQLAAQAPDLHKSLIVQPNFDIMVLAPLQNLPLLQQIDRFALQQSMGDVAMYRMNKESVLKGLRTGLTGADILKILEDNSRVPVAQNIAASLNDWNAEFERLIFRPKTQLLEVLDPAILDKVLADPKTAPYIEKRLGPTFALLKVPSQTFDKALAELSGSKPPLYLDYTNVQPGIISAEGARRLKLKEHSGNPYLFYRLGQFADLVNWNAAKQTASFELSAEAGQRAQRLGQTYDTVRYFLAAFSSPRKNLPPEMELTIKGWLGYYSPLKGERAISITATTAELLDDIFDIEEFKPVLIARATSKVALVKEEGFLQFRERLAEMGIVLSAPELVPDEPKPAELEAATEPVPAEPGRRKGRGPTETAAEKERKQREASEAQNDMIRIVRAPVFGGPPGSFITAQPVSGQKLDSPEAALNFLGLLEALGGGNLFDDDEEDYDDFDPPPYRPRRRKR